MKRIQVKVGLSVRVMYPDETRTVLPAKTLHYAEACMVQWLLQGGALVYAIPALTDAQTLGRYADDLDGLVLQGGSDIAPENYGEKALQPEWAGDAPRDVYELALLKGFLEREKPVLGICRGCQLINVALGGSLYQDIATQIPGAETHRSEAKYDRNFHRVAFEPGSRLAALYGNVAEATINSIHHQALNRLGEGLAVEARSPTDGVIEAVRRPGGSYLAGIQWHPEFIEPGDAVLLDAAPPRDDFLAACAR